MTSISAVITTYNNDDTLGRCLSSVARLADELLVLDSFSSDTTLKIATAYGCSVIQETFRGYGPQKQYAVDLAGYDWILLLDADEALSSALQTELLMLKQNHLTGTGYRLRRREWLAWKSPIEQHGKWQHDWVKLTDHLRLFDRRLVTLSRHPIHAAPSSFSATPLLNNVLLHWGDAPFSYRRSKARRYAELDDRHASPWRAYPRLLLAPVWAFVQDYFLRRGFMNPVLGLAAAAHSAYATFLKYRHKLKFRQAGD